MTEGIVDTAPRKRSKVSRACDACRRKKVRCDGEFSTTQNLVTKKCTNCHKNHDICTFSRVPLKRGPSKGYIRDLEEKLEHTRPRKTSVSSMNGSGSAESPLSMPLHPLSYPNASGGGSSSGAGGQASNSNSSSKSNLSINSNPNITSNPPPSLSNPMSNSLSSKQGSSSIILPPLISSFPQVLPSALHRESQQYSNNNENNSSNNNTNNTNNNDSNSSSPESPRNGNINGILNPTSNNGANSNPHNKSPPIQGPFWKVPYEMPSNSIENRRSSIESISSTNSSISGISSRSRLPSLKPSASASDTAVSDSDDDFYSVKSFSRSRSSQSLSPRNSISSMSSLNGRMNKVNIQSSSSQSTLPQVQAPIPQSHIHHQSHPSQSHIGPNHLQPQPQTQPQFMHTPPTHPTQQAYYASNFHFLPTGSSSPYQQSYPYVFPVSVPFKPQQQGHPFPPQQQQQQQQQQQLHHPQYSIAPNAPIPSLPLISKTPVATLEQNLNTYYYKFHNNFPILPFNESHLKTLLDSMILDDQTKMIIDFFNCALNNLNNYNTINLKENVLLFNKILSIYPFHSFDIKLSDNILIFFFSTLILINYAILLNGDTYSIGLSLTISMLNDFRVLEKFNDFVINKKNSNGHQRDQDDCDSIQLYLPKLYLFIMILDSIYSLEFAVQKVFSISNVMGSNLIRNIDLLIPKGCQLTHGIGNLKISSLLNQLIVLRDERRFTPSVGSIDWNVIPSDPVRKLFPSYFVDLLRDKFEVLSYLTEISSDIDRIDEETLHDYQLKLCRLVKKLSSSIINLANYIPTNSSNNNLMSNQGNKSMMTDGDSNSGSSGKHSELITPLLNLAFGQSYKLIKLSKIISDSVIRTTNDNELFNRCLKIHNDLSIAYNLLNSNLNNSSHPIIGSMALNLIKNKLEYYDLNLAAPISNQPVEKGIEVWKVEYINVAKFIEREYIDGWY